MVNVRITVNEALNNGAIVRLSRRPCLWLTLGVDVVTVQAWVGHVSIATTNLYLHHLGTSGDKAGLDRLNRRGHAGGTQREDAAE
jgi:hypothetical protein